MTGVHSTESVNAALHRRGSAVPLGECGQCANVHGHPKNCRTPATCIHGYARDRVRTWKGENPEWGQGRSKT